jgi:hypothetical protein
MAPTTLTWLGFSWRATALNEKCISYSPPPMLAFITSALSFSSFEIFLFFAFRRSRLLDVQLNPRTDFVKL